MTALIRAGYVAEAHANWSRWVARCGLCPSAQAFYQERPPYFTCIECGTVTEIVWPPPAMVAGVERLLMMRPDPSTRNWYPHETLHDLMFENGAHGIFDNPPEVEPGTVLFSVNDHGVMTDALPALKQRIRKSLE